MNPKDIPILMYHDVSETDNQWCVSPQSFEAQMSHLYKQGYKTISLSQLHSILNNRETKEKYVVLTFDDARKGVFPYAFRTLKKYNFSATVFVVPSWIEVDVPDAEKYSSFMSWDELSVLSSTGWEVGNHTLTHKNMVELSPEERQHEIDKANEILKKRLFTLPRHFAYPFGVYSDVEEIKKRFLTAVTTNRGVDKTPYEFARQWICHDTNINEFMRLLKRPTISLCMIVKNEETTLAQCLESVRGLVDEIVIGDTGSKDSTKKIAAKFTTNLHDISWNNSFADARNEVLKKATGDWVLILDADEVLSSSDHRKMREAVNRWDVTGFQLLTRNYSNNSLVMGWMPTLEKELSRNAAGWYPSLKVRLFQRKENIMFIGEMHEIVDEVIHSQNGKTEFLNAFVYHYGTLHDKSADENADALKRTDEKIKQNPNDAKAYFELGVQLKDAQQFEQAEQAFQRSIDIQEKSVMQRLNLAVVQQKQNKMDAAIKNYEAVLKKYNSADAYFGLGFCWFRKNSMKKAANFFAQAIQLNPYFVDAYVNLGAILEKVSKFDAAEQLLKKAISLHPQLARAHYNLGVVYEKTEETKKAIECYRKAITLNYQRKAELLKRIEHIETMISS